MSSIAPLWLPILLSAVAVFILSSLVHMVLRWHNSDQKPVPNEEAVAAALRGLPRGEYRLPWANSMAEMRDPAWQAKVKDWPIAHIGVWTGDWGKGFGKSLVLWFVYSLVVSWLSGHVAHSALGMTADAYKVFHAVFLTAFAGYGLGQVQKTIWGTTPWIVTIKNLVDSLIYALATAGVFVWLWPK